VVDRVFWRSLGGDQGFWETLHFGSGDKVLSVEIHSSSLYRNLPGYSSRSEVDNRHHFSSRYDFAVSFAGSDRRAVEKSSTVSPIRV